MKFSCEKYLLQAACAVASRATASKSTIPALEGLLLQAELGLTVTGYDLRKGIYTRIEADVEERGSVVVGARFLGEMLRRLPDGVVNVSTDANLNVTVKCGRSEFNFIGISASDFPEIPMVDGVNNITVPQGPSRPATRARSTPERSLRSKTTCSRSSRWTATVWPSAAKRSRRAAWRTAASSCPAAR